MRLSEHGSGCWRGTYRIVTPFPLASVSRSAILSWLMAASSWSGVLVLSTGLGPRVSPQGRRHEAPSCGDDRTKRGHVLGRLGPAQSHHQFGNHILIHEAQV